MRTAVALDAARLELDDGRPQRAASWIASVGEASDLSHADAVDLEGLRGRLAADQGRPAEAAAHADRAVRASLLTDSPLVQATAELDRARTLSALGRGEDALVSARAARDHFASKGHLPGARRAAGLSRDGTRDVTDETGGTAGPMATTTERS
ncbi:hypothetical protein EES45_22530 [Streptomyces sp. ADI97-07]|nr:hypothetical protein EES45_22530 [Streptomyces sp. ADI97-07]